MRNKRREENNFRKLINVRSGISVGEDYRILHKPHKNGQPNLNAHTKSPFLIGSLKERSVWKNFCKKVSVPVRLLGIRVASPKTICNCRQHFIWLVYYSSLQCRLECKEALHAKNRNNCGLALGGQTASKFELRSKIAHTAPIFRIQIEVNVHSPHIKSLFI